MEGAAVQTNLLNSMFDYLKNDVFNRKEMNQLLEKMKGDLLFRMTDLSLVINSKWAGSKSDKDVLGSVALVQKHMDDFLTETKKEIMENRDIFNLELNKINRLFLDNKLLVQNEGLETRKLIESMVGNIMMTSPDAEEEDHSNPKLMFVYLDVIENVIVGHTSVPLLRIVKVPRQKYRGYTASVVFENPFYIKLQKKYFETMEIELRDWSGSRIQFASDVGIVILTLHFKPA